MIFWTDYDLQDLSDGKWVRPVGITRKLTAEEKKEIMKDYNKNVRTSELKEEILKDYPIHTQLNIQTAALSAFLQAKVEDRDFTAEEKKEIKNLAKMRDFIDTRRGEINNL